MKQGLWAVMLWGLSLSAQATVVASTAWIREVPPVSATAAVFVDLDNQGPSAVTVTELSSPLAERVEWHDLHTHDGLLHMQAQADAVLAPGAVRQLQPGGSHLMLVGLRRPLRVGDVVPVSLVLSTRQVVSLNAVVRRSEPAAAGHGHHAH